MAMAVQAGMVRERGWPSCRKASADRMNNHTLETRDGKKGGFGCNCERDPQNMGSLLALAWAPCVIVDKTSTVFLSLSCPCAPWEFLKV